MFERVSILNYNTNAAAIVSAAGRISTMEGTAEEIYAKSAAFPTEKNEKLIAKILSSGHTSVLEHISVNLAFENVSVFVEQFIIEFRLASFTVKSRRYVDFRSAGFYTPEFADDTAKSKYQAGVQALFEIYDKLCAANVPKEDARFVLPYCFHSNFFCTMNGRELVHVMNEMVYGRGKKFPELRKLGEMLFAECEEKLPYLATRKGAEYGAVADLCGKAPMEEVTETKVLAATPNAAEVICNAAMLARGYLPQKLSEDEQKKLLRTLLLQPRKRELEQASFTVLFRPMSLAALTHLTRHRMHALVAPDLLKTTDFGRFVLPQSVMDSGMEETYRGAFTLAKSLRDELLSGGMAEENSVYLLLSGLTVPVLTTMNAGELSVFFRLRCCNRAQWEIRDIATEALFALRKAEPLLFGLYGPTCYQYGRCPEGKMTCGKKAEMCEKFGK